VTTPADAARVGATFTDVFAAGALDVPWYVTGGAPDWLGNISGAASAPSLGPLSLKPAPAELSFNASAATGGRWRQPAKYYTFETVVPIGGDTVQVILLDTESLIGGLNLVPVTMPPLFYPPPAARRKLVQTDAAPAAWTFPPVAAAAGAAGAAPASPVYTPLPAGVDPWAGPSGAGALSGTRSYPPVPPGFDPWAPGGLAAKSTATPAAGGAASGQYAGGSAGSDANSLSMAQEAAVFAGASTQQSAAGLAALAAATATAEAGFTPPPVDEEQWDWVSKQLNSSSSDWIIVVGYHPIWSAGTYGPTWTLVERLLPLMEAAGVALYISGTDRLAQHFTPIPAWSNVDCIVVGNGAYAQVPGTSAADAMPHATDCPDSALQFSFGETR